MEKIEELDRIEDAIEATRRGELVVVVDDTDRENEGDLIMAASPATTERMAFMIRHTSGIICAPMGRQRAERLNLPPMVANNLDPMRTAFTVSVDYRVGMTTGISATERANTVRALAGATVGATNFLRPGHVFPLIARDGGVLARSGHTEAAVDLATMAGLPDTAVLAEVVNDDGTVKRLPELVVFAREHQLRIISIEDLITYRLRTQKYIKRLSEERTMVDGIQATLYVYVTTGAEQWEHIALVFGDVDNGTDIPCRIQQEDPISTLLGTGQSTLNSTIAHFRSEGRGIYILLRKPSILASQHDHNHAAPVSDGETHLSAQARKKRWVDIGVGAQILRDQGVRSIKLLSLSHDKAYVGLSAYGIEIAQRLQL